MTPRPRILVLAPDYPFPVRAGGQMRMASMLPMLADVGTVHIASTVHGVMGDTHRWAQAHGMSIEPVPRDNRSGWGRQMERLAAAVTVSNLRFRRSEYIRFERVCRRFAPDVVWLETPYLLRYALRWHGRIPLVVDYWGTSEGGRLLLERSRGVNRPAHWLRWRCARGAETRYARRLRMIVCISEQDAAFFRSIAPGRPVRVVPISLRPESFEKPLRALRAEPLRMVFTGDMSYRPNIDAAVYFAREILPLIRLKVPGAHIVFAGRDPSSEVRMLADSNGVEVTGAVPSLVGEIVRSSVYVLPMRLGSGIRSKLFEVFPTGIPIVTTSTGAEGLVLRHERNCLMADSAGGFADACIRLLGCEAERDRLGQAMREDAVTSYSYPAVSRTVRSVIEEALDGIVPSGRDSHPARPPSIHAAPVMD